MTSMFLALSFCLALAPDPSAEPKRIIERVQATYKAGGDLTASFKQTHVQKLLGKKKVETGHVWAKKDGRVRWTYDQTPSKEFVYDGKQAIFYEPENAQV